MSLTDRMLRLALWCAKEELDARSSGKTPGVQAWNAELIRALDLELSLSASGQEHVAAVPLSAHEPDEQWIGTLAAARILGWHERQVRRHTTDLQARKVAGKWIFRAAAVRDYAEALTDARDTA